MLIGTWVAKGRIRDSRMKTKHVLSIRAEILDMENAHQAMSLPTIPLFWYLFNKDAHLR
jgi:hypothetical protein